MSADRIDDDIDVVVVGGGQAGLAMGYHLAQQQRRFTILEASDAPAAAWRSRWDSLRLFTPPRHDGLPGLPFPGDQDRYPTRDEVVDYLTEYVRRHELPIEHGTRVTRLQRDGDGYCVDAGDRSFRARAVVVATGPFQTPRTPAFAAALDPRVEQLHSTRYRRSDALPSGPVLVVGGGNTGFQLAAELAATREVHLAVGSRQTPLPQRLLGRDIFDYLTRSGFLRITVDSRLGAHLQHRETLIGSSPRAVRRLGVHVHPRAVGADGGAVLLADGTAVEPAAVIWATGFTREYRWIDVPVLDADGRPVHRRGVTSAPGLFFLGLPWQHTRGSALLGWVADDAAFLADRIAAHLAGPRPASSR